MFVGVALLASLVYGSVQDSRIAYVAVRTDKEVYTSGENVTFKLVPLTDGIEFTMDDQNDPWYVCTWCASRTRWIPPSC